MVLGYIRHRGREDREREGWRERGEEGRKREERGRKENGTDIEEEGEMSARGRRKEVRKGERVGEGELKEGGT